MDEILTIGILFIFSFVFAGTASAQEIDLSALLKQHQALESPGFSQLTERISSVGITRMSNQEIKTAKPPLDNNRKIPEQFLYGCLFEVAVASTLGIIIWAADIQAEEWKSEFDPFLYASLCFSSAVGVSAVGTRHGETASFWATFLGSSLGFSAAWILLSLADIHDNVWLCCIGAYCSPVGAVIGFDLARRCDESGTALVNYRDGQMSLSVPRVCLRHNSLYERGLNRSVDLLRINF